VEKVALAAGLNFLNFHAILRAMINSISEFHRFAYREDNFHDLQDYCNDNSIWICQSLRRKGPLTFALARSEKVADDLARRFG